MTGDERERETLPEGITEERCECGALLARVAPAPPGHDGMLCTECDKEHLEELLAATPLQLLEEALQRQGEALKRLEAVLARRPTEAQMRWAADALQSISTELARSQLVGDYVASDWQTHVESSRAVAEWLHSMALSS